MKAAEPGIASNVVVAGRRGACAFVARDFACSGTDAHAAVEAVRSSVLIGYARPVAEEVLSRLMKAYFPFPGMSKKSFPVRFVETAMISPHDLAPIGATIFFRPPLGGGGKRARRPL